jgi:hypothetical protein
MALVSRMIHLSVRALAPAVIDSGATNVRDIARLGRAMTESGDEENPSRPTDGAQQR